MLYLMTFSSHFDAIFANRTLKSAGLDVRLMPVPRAVSASCGTCVCFPMKEGARPPEALWRHLVWERLKDSMTDVLDSTTLEDMVRSKA